MSDDNTSENDLNNENEQPNEAGFPLDTTDVANEEKALDFYQKLRSKIRKQLDKKGSDPDKKGPEYDRLVESLAVLPDLFHLGVKCLFDKNVPIVNKGALVAGITYVISPIDLVPDFLFIAGWLDDLIVMNMAMNKFLDVKDAAVKEAVDTHWAGEDDAFSTVKRILEIGDAAIDFLPSKFVEMVRAMFAK